MKVSTRGRYALRLMIYLARCDKNSCIALKEISDKENVSIKYLEQIVALLCRAGLVEGIRGSKGGYRLAVEPDKCTAGDVLRITEGSLAPAPCAECNSKCERADICSARDFWKGLQLAVDNYLDGVTISDLAG